MAQAIDMDLELGATAAPPTNTHENEGPPAPEEHGLTTRDLHLVMNTDTDSHHAQLNVDNDQDDNGNAGENADTIHSKELVFSPYYYVSRYSRTLHRSEVLGFLFVSLAIICIALLAQVGLEAVGFAVPTVVKLQATPVSTHDAHSFSWKLLSEFLISDAVSSAEKDCLYMSKNRVVWSTRRKLRQSERSEGQADVTSPEELMEQLLQINFDGEDFFNVTTTSGSGPNKHQHVLACDDKGRIPDGWTWFYRFMISMSVPLLNLCCAIFLLSCIRCRRRKGFQFTLMIPTFLAVFLGVFEQVPLIFRYSYTALVLTDEMNNAASFSLSPVMISPIWDETQYHGRCCGVHSAETWETSGLQKYPPSCCNRIAFSCDKGYPSKEQVWKKGCYKQEYDRIRFYEFFTMVVYMVKLFAEMGILWCLSDLTRYDYPRPEHQHNATCDVRDFEVRSKGCATILGVTEYQHMVIKLKKFNPTKYMFRTHEFAQGKTIEIRTVDGDAGSIEIRRIRRNWGTEMANVNLRRRRLEGLVLISF